MVHKSHLPFFSMVSWLLPDVLPFMLFIRHSMPPLRASSILCYGGSGDRQSVLRVSQEAFNGSRRDAYLLSGVFFNLQLRLLNSSTIISLLRSLVLSSIEMSSPSSSTGSQMGDSSSSIPASILKQAQFAEFFISSLASAWFWDYLMSLREEFIMFSRHRFTFPDSVYVLSRLSTCAFLILSLMDISFNTGGLQNENCHTLIELCSLTCE
ncbi:hypothetical protein ABKN59_010262 [Abortiporus biennis]